MAGYRKLGRTSNQRKAMIRSQVTALLYHGHIKTTETRAKEIRKVAEGLIALAVKEKDNFETVKVTAKVARKDKERYCHDGGCVQRSEQTLRNDRKRHIECKQRRQRCRA